MEKRYTKDIHEKGIHSQEKLYISKKRLHERTVQSEIYNHI